MKVLRATAMTLPLILLAALGGCDDDPTGPDPTTIVGFWTGKYGSGNDYPTAGYAFLFANDGTVSVWDGTDTTTTAGKAEGTYTLTGSTVTTNYTYIVGGGTFSTSGTVTPQFTFLEGTWGSGANTTNGGRFFVVKE